jgi:ATP-dependent DNA ligase
LIKVTREESPDELVLRIEHKVLGHTRVTRPVERDIRRDQRVTAADMLAVRWVPPVLVVEVAFLEFDRHCLLRDPRFLGAGEDKAPHAVCREDVRL